MPEHRSGGGGEALLGVHVPLLPSQDRNPSYRKLCAFAQLRGWWLGVCGCMLDEESGTWSDGEGPRRAGAQTKPVWSLTLVFHRFNVFFQALLYPVVQCPGAGHMYSQAGWVFCTGACLRGLALDAGAIIVCAYSREGEMLLSQCPGPATYGHLGTLVQARGGVLRTLLHAYQECSSSM